MNPLKLKGARTSLGYRQSDMAKIMRIKEGSYQRKESGKSALTLEQALCIMEILHFDLSQFNEFLCDNRLPVDKR